jgi:hypothetical protein
MRLKLISQNILVWEGESESKIYCKYLLELSVVSKSI